MRYILQLASILTTTVQGMSTIAKPTIVHERTFTCSDGVKLATRHWVNFDASSSPPPLHTRKFLCLHGWLDNAASFNRLAPLLLESSSLSDIPTEICALDFPGHGLSGHKSVDGPPQLLAEYAYYVAELVEAMQWGKGNDGSGNNAGISRTVVANVNQNTNTKNNDSKEGSDVADVQKVASNCDVEESSTKNNNNKIVLIGHSMGSGVSVVLCAAFPEWFSSFILLEGGLVARNAKDASRHVRAACQRRLKSNKTLFPSISNGSSDDATTTLPRTKVYSNLNAAIEARLYTTSRMPGDQYLSYEAAKDMVMRATSKVPGTSSTGGESVTFRHDPRLQWPSLQYYTREQVEAFFHDIHVSNIPVCFLWAEDGWPVDTWQEDIVKNVLQPVYMKKLPGSHHLHADPDSVNAVADEIVKFMY